MSSDGFILAIGSSSGYVKAFQYIDDNWVQIGNDLVSDESNSFFGSKVSINSDGSIIAIGASRSDSNGNDTGKVSVYKNINNIWTQIGSDIEGEIPEDRLGMAVDLNSDGSILAIGAKRRVGPLSSFPYVKFIRI